MTDTAWSDSRRHGSGHSTEAKSGPEITHGVTYSPICRWQKQIAYFGVGQCVSGHRNRSSTMHGPPLKSKRNFTGLEGGFGHV